MSILTLLTRVVHFAVPAIIASCSSFAMAEGSRTLYPDDYDPLGRRAALDLQSSQLYLNRVRREGFHYVYAEMGEYILVASSNRNNAGDIEIYNPQDFGTPGDEDMGLSVDFDCTNGSGDPSDFSGPGRGYINNRVNELAGPRALLDTTTNPGYSACGYLAPVTGIYGVRFGTANTGGGPNGNIGGSIPASSQTSEAWDITVRADAASTEDINGRVFTYAFIGYTGGNNRPVFHSLYYITTDGYRYRQDLRGLDPNGYALYANTFGFLDDNQPLYKTLRGDNFNVSNLPLQVTTQSAQYPIFYSDVMDPDIEDQVEVILQRLGIPDEPPSPTISNVTFNGVNGSTTALGVGGEFTFDTTGTVSYEIVISRGNDFDPGNVNNRVLTGIAYAGSHVAIWDGLDNKLQPFPEGSYSYRAGGRAGEVHFPIIDAENNDRTDSNGLLGGGPTIVRLNGEGADTDPENARTVFFDDRGYITSSGELIGDLNDNLCGGTGRNPADPPQALAGVDSLTPYRLWQGGGNSNSDCSSSAGWGDAKAVNLWTYFLTQDPGATLNIVETTIDLATSVVAPDSVAPGDTVQGTVSFSNFGNTPASNVVYTLTLSPALGTVDIQIPPGVPLISNYVNGVVTFTPTGSNTLPANTSYSGITFNYTAPATGPVVATSTISSPDDDDVPSNNTDIASTAIGAVDVISVISGVSPTVEPGEIVTGSVVFASIGTDNAAGITYSMQFGSPGAYPDDVTFPGLPSAYTATYDNTTGLVTFSGLPETLQAGNSLPLNFQFTSRIAEGVSYPITSQISTTDNDANPINDTSSAAVVTGYDGASINITATPLCENDVPFLLYDIQAVGFTPNNLATVEFVNPATGVVVATYSDQPLENGRILWPEAAVDAAGNGIAWPGWEFSGGVWSQIPSQVRPNVEVRISVNPTETVTASYPPATPACVAEAPPGRLADLVTTITANDTTVLPGGPSGGTVAFNNNGPATAFNTVYSLTIGSAGLVPGNIVFSGLPLGASAMVNPNSGIVTFTGMPDTLNSGDMFSFSYTYEAPIAEGGVIDVSSAIDSSTTDSDPLNNTAADSTDITFPPNVSISIDAQSVCDKNAPYVEYDITAVGFTPNTLATVRFIDSAGSTVQTLTDQPLTGVRLLWPDAAVDGTGEGVAWPGWSFSGGVWTQIPSLVRPDLRVEISVNPSSEVTLSYPPATPDCDASPPPARAVDAAVTITGLPPIASEGDTATGTVTFTNAGPNNAEGASYTLSVGEPGNTSDDVSFSSLPSGVSASYDPTTGVVTLTGMPTELDVGDSVDIELSYTMPAGSNGIVVQAAINTTNPDSDSTNNSAAATTAPEPLIVIDAESVCDKNAPYVEYDVTAVGFTPNTLATVRFIDSAGSTVQTLTDQPLTGVRLLWPDAAVDGIGEGVAWPGWSFSGGVWAQIPSLVRPDLRVEISVNPSSEVTLSYPPATPDCDANPPSARTVDATAALVGFPPVTPEGDIVSGTVQFANNGSNTAEGVSYTLSVGEPGNTPDDVTFPSLPTGVMASYDPVTGAVTLTGMPTELDAGDSISIDLSFTMPADSSGIVVAAAITTTNPESDSTNNSASVISEPAPAPPSVSPTAPVPVPSLPPAILFLLMLMIGIMGATHVQGKRSC